MCCCLSSEDNFYIRSVISNSLRPHELYSPWNSPGQTTGVGSLSLLQGIFPTQGSNPGLPHCRQILQQLNHKGSPRRLEWVAYPFSSGSSQPRNWTGVSCIAGGVFTNWVIREALIFNLFYLIHIFYFNLNIFSPVAPCSSCKDQYSLYPIEDKCRCFLTFYFFL